MLQDINQWFLALGAEYGVNPYIFGGIYVGAIPFFIPLNGVVGTQCTGWKVDGAADNARWVLFVSAYIYLAIAGRNIPIWVWVFLAALIVYGAWSSIRDTRKKIAEAKAEDSTSGSS